jgi:hypothetical protein
MYFAPFVGAVRETLRLMREIQAENEQRNARRMDKPSALIARRLEMRLAGS